MKTSIPDRKWVAGSQARSFLIVLILMLAVPASHGAVRYEVLTSFGSVTNDAQIPDAGLLEGSDGALYGTTVRGGSNNLGAVFRLNKNGGVHSVLHHFGGTSLGDGSGPQSGLLEGSDGALYGTTPDGGTNDTSEILDGGTVFKLNKDGSDYRVLHHFSVNTNDGLRPYGRLIEGSDGVLYGTTYAGGALTNFSRGGLGTVFKLNKDGSNFEIVRSFGSPVIGRPSAGLIESSDGALYGTTLRYLFKLNKDGSGFATSSGLGTFNSAEAHLLEANDGWIYGASQSGSSTDCPTGGTLIRANKDLTGLQVLRDFSLLTEDGCYRPEGYNPRSGLMQGSDGALYGTLSEGGAGGGGAVFTMHKDGSGFRVLHSFAITPSDGTVPIGALLQASDGALYGTTSRGGEFGFGTVFKIYWPVVITRYQRSGDSAMLGWSGVPNWPYCIQARTNLSACEDGWVDIDTNVTGLDGTFQVSIPEPPDRPARFYRIKHSNLLPPNFACVLNKRTSDWRLAIRGYVPVAIGFADGSSVEITATANRIRAFLQANFTETTPVSAADDWPEYRRGNSSGFHSFQAYSHLPIVHLTITTGPCGPGEDPGILNSICGAAPGIIYVAGTAEAGGTGASESLGESQVQGPWLPTMPVTFTNALHTLPVLTPDEPMQFFRLRRQ